MEVIQNKSVVSVASGVSALGLFAGATLLKSSTLYPSLNRPSIPPWPWKPNRPKKVG